MLFTDFTELLFTIPDAYREIGFFQWVILPLLIFFARIIDVSLGTLRLIFVSRGMQNIAPFLGFIEVFIWLVTIGQIMQNLTNIMAYIAYAGGFAMGTFVGMAIEKKLSLGLVIVRIITKPASEILIERLREENYGITIVDAEGTRGMVKLIFMVLKRKNVAEMIKVLNEVQPNAFYTIEDVRFASEGVFPATKSVMDYQFLNMVKPFRKGK